MSLLTYILRNVGDLFTSINLKGDRWYLKVNIYYSYGLLILIYIVDVLNCYSSQLTTNLDTVSTNCFFSGTSRTSASYDEGNPLKWFSLRTEYQLPRNNRQVPLLTVNYYLSPNEEDIGRTSEIPTSHRYATDDMPHPATYGVAITDELPTTGMASEIPTSHIYATDDIPHPATDEGVSEEIVIFSDVASKPTERRTNDPEELVTSREPSTEGWQATMTKYSLVKTGKS